MRVGLWVILIKGLTPIPYKIVTIASGAAQFNFWLFMAASMVTRGMRFFLVAALLRVFGTPVRDFIERRLALVTGALAAGRRRRLPAAQADVAALRRFPATQAQTAG